MRLSERVNRHLPAPGSNRGFDPDIFVQTLITLLTLGGQTLSDLRDLEREKSLLGLLDQTVIPDEDTVGPWLRRMGDPEKTQPGLVGLEKVKDEVIREILSRDGVKDYTLVLELHLVRKGTGPVFVFQGEGIHADAGGPVREWTLCGRRVPGGESFSGGWPHSRVSAGQGAGRNVREDDLSRVRADNASYQAELINALEEDGVQWTITADKNSAVKFLIDRIPEKDWTSFPSVAGESVEVAETVHTMTGTPKAFRLLVKRVRDRSTPIGALLVSYRYWVVATNFGPEASVSQVLSWHQQRGEFENFFKGLKNNVGVGYLPTGDLHGNAVFFQIGVLAYNLFIGFKRDLLPASCRTWTLRTVRWKIFSMAGRIVRHARSLVLKLAVDADSLDLLTRIRGQCHALFCPA